MQFILNFVICLSCFSYTLCERDTYKAAVVDSPKLVDLGRYTSIIKNAAHSNADIVVLPTPDEANHGAEQYDEAIKALSSASKSDKIYVATHLYEKVRCEGRSELVRSNLVFDRRGSVVAVYRKPVNEATNCTSSPAEVPSFTTDFGVTFGLMMQEDLVLKPAELKNYIIAGDWKSEIPFLSASQLAPSWSYVSNANLISSTGIYSGSTGLRTTTGRLSVVELHKNGGTGKPVTPVTTPTANYPSEDLTQYMVQPLNVDASLRGYTETVCHGSFCCQFYVKIDFVAPVQPTTSYGLAVYNGQRHFGGTHHIGSQTCALFACAGLYKRSCVIESENNSTNIHFEKISITGNFSGPNKAQFPVILSPSQTPLQAFKLQSETVKNCQKVTIEAYNAHSLVSFGIFARDFSKDYETIIYSPVNTEGLTIDVYEYLLNEDVLEFFDYLWIRLRVLLIVVSIYVLEMM